MSKSNFPSNFLWGSSTAGHQVEGDLYDNWTVWEDASAQDLAKNSHKHSWTPVWPEVKAQAENPDNYISGSGVDHYSRYKEDFKIIKKLNLNSFRFSVEWSRIEPEEGKWDQAEIDRYVQYVRDLKAEGIEPMLNLWHWTHPVWFEDKGAFTKKSNIKYFERFVRKLAPLIEEVKYIVTINEPNNVAWFQYIAGEWPPAEKGKYLKGFRVFRNLITAHKRSYKAIKQINSNTLVTTALSSSSNVPNDPHKLSHRLAARLANYAGNTWYLKRVDKYHDVIGFNYYFKNYVGVGKGFKNPDKPLSDLGWYMEPYGIIDVLRMVSKKFNNKPIIILENGVADRNDAFRGWWIDETMKALSDARAEGVNLIGYYHWSLLDNFEWAYGWWPNFGLVHVDRKTMKRTIRPSAKQWSKWLQDISTT